MKKFIFYWIILLTSFHVGVYAQSKKDLNPYEKFLMKREQYVKYLKVAPKLAYSKVSQKSKDYFKTQNQFYALDSIVSDSTKIEYLYDVEGFVTDMITYQLNTNGDWFEDTKEEYVYLPNDDLADIIIYEFDELTSSWVQSMKLEIVYNTNNLVDEENLYSWDTNTNQWIKVMYNIINYNVNNLIADEEWFEFNFGNMQFEESFKVVYQYNSNQDLDYLTYYYFDDVTSTYEESHRFDYYYNTSQQLDMIIEQNYDDINFTWVDTIKTVFNYNSGVLSNEETFYWSDLTNAWEEDYKFVYSFNQTVTINDLILPEASFYFMQTENVLDNDYLVDEESLYFNYMLESADEYEFDSSNYQLVDMSDYYYSIINIASKANKKFHSVNIYPNPVKDIISIQGISNGTIQIFNAQGQSVYEGSVNENMNMGHLTSGVYTFKVQNQSQYYSGKFIKE